MKRIPVSPTGRIVKNIILLSFYFMSLTFISSQPIIVTNSTSVGSENCKKLEIPPIVQGNTLVIEVQTDWQINIVDFNASLTFAESNLAVSIDYNVDGYSNNGLPIWNAGSHIVEITFKFDIEPINPDRIVELNIFIENSLAGLRLSGLPEDFNGSSCFVVKSGHNIPVKAKSPKSKRDEQKIDNDKTNLSLISGLILSDVNPRLKLDVKNNKTPITIFLTNIANPSVNEVVLNKRNLDRGVYYLPLTNEPLPFGIYQLVIQQGRDIQTIKYFHSH